MEAVEDDYSEPSFPPICTHEGGKVKCYTIRGHNTWAAHRIAELKAKGGDMTIKEFAELGGLIPRPSGRKRGDGKAKKAALE